MRTVCGDLTGSYLEGLSGITRLMKEVNLDDFDEIDDNEDGEI